MYIAKSILWVIDQSCSCKMELENGNPHWTDWLTWSMSLQILKMYCSKNPLTPWYVEVIQVCFSNSLYELIPLALLVKWVWGECHRIPLMIRQHWFRQWLDTKDFQAIIITWTNVDQVLWCLAASLGNNDLGMIFLSLTLSWHKLTYLISNLGIPLKQGFNMSEFPFVWEV